MSQPTQSSFFDDNNVIKLQVAFPGTVISILPPDVTLSQLADDGKMLKYQTDAVFMAVLNQLHRIKQEAQTDLQSAAITECVLEVEDEQDCIAQKVPRVTYFYYF